MTKQLIYQLKELEELSEKISDMIFKNNFDKVLEYDQRRQHIIKNIKLENSKNFKDTLKNIILQNCDNINKAENQIYKFDKNSKKSFKRLTAYSNTKFFLKKN